MANFFVFIFVYSTLSFLHNFTHKKTFSLHLSRNLSPNPRHVQHRCKIPCKLPFSRARHNWHFLAIEPTKAIYLWFIVFRIYKHGTSESSDLSKAAFSTELGPLVPVSVVCCLQGTWPCITEWFDQTCIFLWIFMTGMRISIYLHRLPLRLCPPFHTCNHFNTCRLFITWNLSTVLLNMITSTPLSTPSTLTLYSNRTDIPSFD